MPDKGDNDMFGFIITASLVLLVILWAVASNE
jgi:hypothetical protein